MKQLMGYFCLAVALSLPSIPRAAETVHLLGFVGPICPLEPYCFQLLVKPEFAGKVGNQIIVRFSETTKLFDPENFELTLQQQNIVSGSHLRMLIESDTNGKADEYQASFIWIGD